MPFTFTQILLTVFLIFALSRVVLRFKGGNVSLTGLMFWGLLFGSAIVFVLIPEITSDIATTLGIGRGADAVVYSSIVVLFYLVFRLYVYIQDIRQDITDIVKTIALKDAKKNDKTSKS